jgi:hypothetical protein
MVLGTSAQGQTQGRTKEVSEDPIFLEEMTVCHMSAHARTHAHTQLDSQTFKQSRREDGVRDEREHSYHPSY